MKAVPPSCRRLAWGGVAGPVGFTGAWVAAAALRPAYQPVEDTISRLAAVGATNRWLMTAGFVAFGVGVPLYARALRDAVPGCAWMAAVGTGVATLGVAAVPLEVSGAVDTVHDIAAGAGYVALAAIPLLAAPAFRTGRRRRAATMSTAAGASCAVVLLSSLAGTATGALQRAGLGIGHAWVVASAVWMLAGGRIMPASNLTAPTTEGA